MRILKYALLLVLPSMALASEPIRNVPQVDIVIAKPPIVQNAAGRQISRYKLRCRH